MNIEMAKKVTLNLPWNRKNTKNGKIFICSTCKINKIYRTLGDIKKHKYHFCSRKCANAFDEKRKLFSLRMSGKKLSEETKNKLRLISGNKASGWKGGRPKCLDCGKEIWYGRVYCSKCKCKHWSKETLRKRGKAISNKRKGCMPINITREGKFCNVKRGWFDINGKSIFFRSKWEANYARYLDFLIKNNNIIKWEYEPDVFIFEKIKSGTRSYRPDFKIYLFDDKIEYHEIKGWMTPRSKTQIKRMRIYYPNIKLIVIDRKFYADICKKIGQMLNFE